MRRRLGLHRQKQAAAESGSEAACHTGARSDRHARRAVPFHSWLHLAGIHGGRGLNNIREAILGCLETRAAHGMPFTIEVRGVEVPA